MRENENDVSCTLMFIIKNKISKGPFYVYPDTILCRVMGVVLFGLLTVEDCCHVPLPDTEDVRVHAKG